MTVEAVSARHHWLASQPLLPVALSCAAGIVADRYFVTPLEWDAQIAWWLTAIVATSAALTLLNFRCLHASCAALLLAAGCLGGTWHHFRWNQIPRDDLARFAREVSAPVCLEGVVAGASRWSPAPAANPLRAIPAEPQSEFDLQVTRLRNGTHWQDVSGVVRLRVNGTLRPVWPGEQLRVYARLGRNSPPLNPGQYDYAQAQRARGRYCELYTRSPSALQSLGPPPALTPARFVTHLTDHSHRQLARYVGPEQRAIATALLLGARNELADETLAAFQKTGTIHLLVVSGLHVGLLVAVVIAALGAFPVPPVVRLLLTLAFTLLYAAIVGWQSPVVRSAVLVTMTLLGYNWGRRPAAVSLLAAAALVVLALNPAELFRGGTQLSFLGVAAVVGSAQCIASFRKVDPLEEMLAAYRPVGQTLLRGFLRRMLALFLASLSVWVVVTPLVMFHFNIITPAASIITPVVWPLVAVALVTGMGVTLCGTLFPPLAWLLGQVCHACLAGTEGIVDWASRIPASHFYTPSPAWWWVTVLYCVALAVAVVPHLRFRWPQLAAFTALWIAVGLGVSTWHQRAPDELRCSFLAVGHGTCAVLQLPGSQTVLYDAGSLGSPQTAANIISAYLWEQGITHIDAVVLSHPDIDHYNALPDLCERFSIGTVFVSPLMFDAWANRGQMSAPNFLKDALDAARIPIRQVWMNDRLHLADPRVTLEVLHPPQVGVGGRDNASSLLVAVEYAGRRILLPGDLESPGIESVIAEPPLDADILLAPHHGSNYSNPPGFATWCTPEWVVLSGGVPSPSTASTTDSYTARGAEVFHTALTGAVEFTLSTAGVTSHIFVDSVQIP